MESLQRAYEQETKAFSTVHYLLRTVNQFLFECSDEELEKFKRQAIENEEYDIAKRIKQEQDERKLGKERSASLSKIVAIRNKESEELSSTMNSTLQEQKAKNDETQAVIIPIQKDQEEKPQKITIEDLDRKGDDMPNNESNPQLINIPETTTASNLPTVPKQSKIISKTNDNNKYGFNIPIYSYKKKEYDTNNEKQNRLSFGSLEILSEDDETAKKELYSALKFQAETQRKKSENLVKNHFDNDVRYSMYVKEFIGYFENLCMKNNERIEQLNLQKPLDAIYQRYKNLLNLMVTEQITRGEYFNKVISMFENIEESIKKANEGILSETSEKLSIPK